MFTYAHPDHKHKFVISSEELHYTKGSKFTLQQINEDRSLNQREVTLTEEDWSKMKEQLEAQGWKQLLTE